MPRFLDKSIYIWKSLQALLMCSAVACSDLNEQRPQLVGHANIRQSCFAGQVAETGPETTLSSIVHIIVGGPDGPIAMGTGFAVADSAGPDGLPRILTAAHVVAAALEAPGLTSIQIILPDGRVVGHASVMATAVPWNPLNRDDPAIRDLAVLALRPANPEMSQSWRQLPGLRLAQHQRGDSLLRARFANPAGPDLGASGAPMMDGDGLVRGVLTKVQSPEPVAVSLRSADIGRAMAGDSSNRLGRLPRQTTALADPVSAAPVLAALNGAGRGIVTAPVAGRGHLLTAVTAGYPRRLCVRFQGEMIETALPPDAASVERVRRALAANG